MYIKSGEYLSKFTGKQIDDAISGIRDYEAELALKADKSTTVNGFPLEEDIVLTADDVGALSNETKYGASINYENGYLDLMDQDGSVLESKLIAVPFTGATASQDGNLGFVPTPEAGDNTKFLRGDGSWASMSGGASSLEDLTDVSIVNPVQGQSIVYDSENQIWKNTTPRSSTPITFVDWTT